MSHELYLFSTGLSFPPQQMLLSRISDHRCHRLGVSTTSNPLLLRRWIRCSSIVHRAVLDWLTSKANVSICQFNTFNRQCRNSRALSKYSKYVIPPSITPWFVFLWKCLMSHILCISVFGWCPTDIWRTFIATWSTPNEKAEIFPSLELNHFNYDMSQKANMWQNIEPSIFKTKPLVF